MNRPLPRWPLYLIASPAAIAVWSEWVGLGTLCGFGIVHPLPGIADGFTIKTAITLPVGVEAYGAYALRAWLTPGVSETARTFARCSAIGSLALGMLGQVVYHLLSAAHATRSPWPVVVLVSCLPVVTLGFGAALTHLLRAADDAPEVVPIPALDDDARTVTPAVPEAVPTPPVPDARGAVARRARRQPGNGHARKAERKYAAHLAEGRLPSLRSVMRDLGVGQDKAREVRQHLAGPRHSRRGGIMTGNTHAELAELDGEIVKGEIVDEPASRTLSVVQVVIVQPVQVIKVVAQHDRTRAAPITGSPSSPLYCLSCCNVACHLVADHHADPLPLPRPEEFMQPGNAQPSDHFFDAHRLRGRVQFSQEIVDSAEMVH